MKTTRPESEAPVPAGWFGDLHDDIRSMIAVGDGKTVFVDHLPTGQVIRVKLPPAVSGDRRRHHPSPRWRRPRRVPQNHPRSRRIVGSRRRGNPDRFPGNLEVRHEKNARRSARDAKYVHLLLQTAP